MKHMVSDTLSHHDMKTNFKSPDQFTSPKITFKDRMLHFNHSLLTAD